jgi:hypothetical protein
VCFARSWLRAHEIWSPHQIWELRHCHVPSFRASFSSASSQCCVGSRLRVSKLKGSHGRGRCARKKVSELAGTSHCIGCTTRKSLLLCRIPVVSLSERIEYDGSALLIPGSMKLLCTVRSVSAAGFRGETADNGSLQRPSHKISRTVSALCSQ